MRIVVAPVVVGTRLCRIVSPLDALLEVEEWCGEWWAPSSVTLTEAAAAPPAPEDLLRGSGLPENEWKSATERPGAGMLESLLLTHDPERPGEMRFDDAAVVVRFAAARTREYPGNARFRKQRRRGRTNGDA